ncbi:galactose oxidase [Gigaspora margarita]|uniref:Galactose oxidase n=1 Tax=Gigaspora margarita TaxID=4874 RepID=A0A8H4AS32_GIGMA|nr:galactose oxidase [Gigaspora margarita]
MNLIKNLIYFFLVLSHVNLFVISDDYPSSRWQQTASLVNNKLYYFGGIGEINYNSVNEVWYLDLSSPFNVSMPPWHKDQGLPPIIYASSCVSPIDNSVFLIGGIRPSITNTDYVFYPSEVYEFYPNTSYWNFLNITGYNSSFNTRYAIEAVVDNDGKIFIFGGTNSNISNYSNTTVIRYNDMHMFDTTTMKWSTLNIFQNVPLPCNNYAAVLLPTAEIIYIGGLELPRLGPLRLVDMKTIRLFNTKAFTWSTKQITGASIDSRGGHTAVITQNGSIIIYGGVTINSTQVSPDLAVLNINTWEWSIPKISQINAPQPLALHSATIYKNYMIISFGWSILKGSSSSFIYILDIRSYTWVTTTAINNLGPFEPTPTPTNAGIPSSSTPTLIIVVTSVAGIFLIGSAIAGMFIYKKRQERRQYIATPGSK